MPFWRNLLVKGLRDNFLLICSQPQPGWQCFGFCDLSFPCAERKCTTSPIVDLSRLVKLEKFPIMFSSVQSLDRLGRRGDMIDDSAEALFQSFQKGAVVSSFGMGRDVHSLMLSIQHFLCRPRRRPPSKTLRKAVVVCDNGHGHFLWEKTLDV